MKELPYSNKTIIGNLKSLTHFGVFNENMEKIEKEGRVVWVKTYQLLDVGKWFTLLLAEEKDLSEREKAEILQNIFRSYIRWVKEIAQKLHVNQEILVEIFMEEMK